MRKVLSLARLLIEHADGEAYRAGRLTGWRHPKVDKAFLDSVGGMRTLLEQAKALEQDPSLGGADRFRADWRDMGTDIRQIHYDVSIIGELCRREGMEDPRERQQKLIACANHWKDQVKHCGWIAAYYDDVITKLDNGKMVPHMEDEALLKCLNAVAGQREFVWERVFSAKVFNDSKKFGNSYKNSVFTIIKNYSPYYVEGMSEDELYAMHEIHSYAQILEWKGPLQYTIDGNLVVDTSSNRYGTVLNTQTMEHSAPSALPGCKKVMTIENKANYESMLYGEEVLYIFCHGYFTPKEIKFLRGILEIVPPDCEFYHWGDMDFGGISIFQFMKEKLFAELAPYKMDAAHFRAAMEAGAGIRLEAGARRMLEAKDAGILGDLKEVILETNMTIEQEQLL